MNKAVKFIVMPAMVASSLLFSQKAAAQMQPSQNSPAPRAFAQMAPKIDKTTAAWPVKEAKKETYPLSKGDTLNLASQRPDATLRIFSSKGIKVKGLVLFSKNDDGYLNGKLEYIDPASGKKTGIIIHVTPSRRAAQNAEAYLSDDQFEHALKLKQKPVKESRQKGFLAQEHTGLSASAMGFFDDYLIPYSGVGLSYRLWSNENWSLVAGAAVAFAFQPQYWGGPVDGRTDDTRSGNVVVRNATTRNIFIEIPSLSIGFHYSHFFASAGASFGMIKSLQVASTDEKWIYNHGKGTLASVASSQFDLQQYFVAFQAGVGWNFGPKLFNIAIFPYAQVNFLVGIFHTNAFQQKSPYVFTSDSFSEYEYKNAAHLDNHGVVPNFGVKIIIPILLLTPK